MAHENATPRPWHVDDENDVLDASGSPIAFTLGDNEAEEADNAALIVEAVNAYDTLRAENERLRSAVRSLLEWDKRRGFLVPYAVRDPLHAALSPESAS